MKAPILRLAPLALALLSLGCLSSVQLTGTFRPESTKIRSYTLGANQTVSIGDPIVTVQNGALRPTYAVRFDYQPPDAGAANSQKPMTKGMLFTACDDIPNDSAFLICNDAYLNAVAIGPSGYVSPHGWIGTKGTLRGLHHIQGAWTTDQLFERAGGEPMTGSFKAELIYSGLTGSTLKVIYREYSNDYARPAFTTDLQYNLEESKEIAYKSIRIEVLNATNRQLDFRVVSDGDLPWLP